MLLAERPSKRVGPFWSALSGVWRGPVVALDHTSDVLVQTGAWQAVCSWCQATHQMHPWMTQNATSDLNLFASLPLWICLDSLLLNSEKFHEVHSLPRRKK